MPRPKGSKNKKTIKTEKGLGDIVESITEATGVKKFLEGKDCGCDKRKELLNKIKITKRIKVECFTEDEYNSYKSFISNRSIKLLGDLKAKGTLQDEQINFVTKLYANKTNTREFKICRNCSPKPIIKMIEVLDELFDTY